MTKKKKIEDELQNTANDISQAENTDATQTENPTEPATDDVPELTEEEKMQQALDLAHQEQQNLQDSLVRLQADFDNFRKRSRQDMDNLSKYAVSQFIVNLLPVIDNFERAMTVGLSEDNKSYGEGVTMIYRQLSSVLETAGVQVITAVGEVFNPEIHEAIGQEDAGEENKNKVVIEVQKGYKLHGRLLRPSMVKVGI